jgi:hypothetical protein
MLGSQDRFEHPSCCCLLLLEGLSLWPLPNTMPMHQILQLPAWILILGLYDCSVDGSSRWRRLNIFRQNAQTSSQLSIFLWRSPLRHLPSLALVNGLRLTELTSG